MIRNRVFGVGGNLCECFERKDTVNIHAKLRTDTTLDRLGVRGLATTAIVAEALLFTKEKL